MSHSVRRHLRVDVDAYDEIIRCFIPGYEAMLDAAARAVAPVHPGLVLDLGAGTGALSEVILGHDAIATIELVDVDPEMLGQARARLERFGDRARFREQSFLDPLPACDAVAASLSLHHIPEIEDKRALYRRIHACLRPGGVFVNADAVMPSDPEGRKAGYAFWAAHMVSRGIPEERAYRHFAEWAEEDTYQPIELELAAMAAAGFTAEVAWHEGPMAVLVGRGALDTIHQPAKQDARPLPLRRALLDMARLDRSVRAELAASGALFNVGYEPRMAGVHQCNAQRLRRIMESVGWPGSDLVGCDGAEAAWMILQHAISEPDLLRRALPLLTTAAREGKADPAHAAMLEDRIRFFEGRPQRYGTQLDWDADGNLSPGKVEDAQELARRRRAVGLPSLEQQIDDARSRAAAEQERPPADYGAYVSARDQWAADVGWRAG